MLSRKHLILKSFSTLFLENLRWRKGRLSAKRSQMARGLDFLTPLFLSALLSKMPPITVESGLSSRGTFRKQFSFHSWQVELDC